MRHLLPQQFVINSPLNQSPVYRHLGTTAIDVHLLYHRLPTTQRVLTDNWSRLTER
jgi:hypothetical protein